jgi:Zn-dependent oligopeptidase
METETEPLIFYQNVSTSKELRDASNAAEVLRREYGIEMSMRVDVYQAKVNAEKNIKASGRKLNPEEERLVEKLVLDGKRAGLDLPEEERKELEKLKKELSQTCVEFSVSFVPGLPHRLLRIHLNRKTSTKRM